MNKSKTNFRGFTLIELLVVVAIIGILSAIMLASLESTRRKGRAASAKETMSSMRAEAEMARTVGGKYPNNICQFPGGSLDRLHQAVLKTGATNIKCQCDGVNPSCNGSGPEVNSWAYGATLADNTGFCVDSTGFAGVNKTILTPGAGACVELP